MAGTDDSWKLLQQVHDWIKVADAKAGALLAASGVLAGITVRILPETTDWAAAPWQVALGLTSLVLTITSAFVALRVFAPRLRSRDGSRSLLYFDHIAQDYATGTDFKLAFAQAITNEGDMNEAIRDQIWVNSGIARKKFRLVTGAAWLFTFALLISLLVGIIKRP